MSRSAAPPKPRAIPATAQPKVLPKHVRESLPVDKKTIYYKDHRNELLDASFERCSSRSRKPASWASCSFSSRDGFFRIRKLAHIDDCMERMEEFRLAVEFQHPMWFDKGRERTLEFERERGIVNVIVDEPQGLKTSVPAVWAVTCPDVAMVRLHGRNHSTWERKGLKAASQRFDGLQRTSVPRLWVNG